MKMQDAIHICFGLHDADGKYSKYTAATMASILDNTKSKIVFHIIHDDSLTKENKNRIEMTAEGFECCVKFYRIDIDEKEYEKYNLKRFTVGTLFKLMVCDELRDVTDKVIYLDSDIIVNLDIKELWNESLSDKLIGAVLLPPKDESIWPLLSKGIIKRNEYFNTGMMVIDISRLNIEHDLWNESIDFIVNKPDLWRAPDQDAITYIFKGKIKELPEKYNSKVSEYRKGDGNESKCIFHFIADSPKDTYEFLPDKLFYKCLCMTPWGSEEKILEHYEKRIREKDEQKENVYRLMKAIYSIPRKKVVFWGVRGDIHEKIMNKLSWTEGDYYVDNNIKTWGTDHGKGKVYSPEKLKTEDLDKTIVVVTVFRYNEIRPILEEYGYTENVNFFNGKILLPEIMLYTCNGERESKWDL